MTNWYSTMHQDRISDTRKGTKRNTVGFKLLLFDPFRNADWYKVNTKSYKANKGLRLIDLIPAVSVYFGSELSFGNIYPYGEPFSPIFDLKTPELKQDEISGELMLITQNHFLNNFVLVTNWGRRYLGSAYEQNYISSSLMIPYQKKIDELCRASEYEKSTFFRCLSNRRCSISHK